MKTAEYTKAVRDIADFYDRNPMLKFPYSIDEEGLATVFYHDNNTDKLGFVHFIRALGKVDKQYTEDHIVVTSLYPKFKLYMNRAAVCVPVKREKKLIPAQPAREAYEVEVVTEWKCGSILETELMATQIAQIAASEDIPW